MSDRILSSSALVAREYDGIDLPAPFGKWLGAFEPNSYVFVWGPPGGGKSTLSAAMAWMLAHYGRVLYISAEEGHGKTVADRFARLDATHDNLFVSLYESFQQIVNDLRRLKARFVVIDSVTEIDPSSKEMKSFKSWCKQQGIGMWFIAHAQKTGRSYKGNSNLGHGADVVVKVEKGKASTTKNRNAPNATVPVPFTAAQMPKGFRDNPTASECRTAGTGRKQSAACKAMFSKMGGSNRERPATTPAKKAPAKPRSTTRQASSKSPATPQTARKVGTQKVSTRRQQIDRIGGLLERAIASKKK
ncbi:MAG: AAA family ATPase [Bacteroidetes bacterium]|nr:AAA family ATPase [Bacteroidota bacterium]